MKTDGTKGMDGDLYMDYKKIKNLANPTANNDGVNLKSLNNALSSKASIAAVTQLSSSKADKTQLGAYWKRDGTVSMTGDLNMNGKKIRNLLTTNENDEAATKKYADNLLHNHQIISTHLKNEFDYLMSNVLEWTELTPLGYRFDMPKTDILSARIDNFHSYNKKVIYTTLIKNTQGGYSYKMGIQCHRLQRNINYTMCTELFNGNYELWHKANVSVDKTTSQGLTIGNVSAKNIYS